MACDPTRARGRTARGLCESALRCIKRESRRVLPIWCRYGAVRWLPTLDQSRRAGVGTGRAGRDKFGGSGAYDPNCSRSRNVAHGFDDTLCKLRAVSLPRTQTLALPALLGPADPAPFVVLGEHGRAPALVVCDHASRAFPRSLDRLGLPELATWQHIAWDIGAGELARGLAHALDAPAVLAGYSRLVVDCNRSPDDADWCRVESDGRAIPGNRGLDGDARRGRLGAIFEPYHGGIEAMLRGFHARAVVPMLIAVHSFAPRLGNAGAERPWHVGVLWDSDETNARRLLAGLRAQPGLVVGDNEPYSGKHPANYTIDRHARATGLPHVCIEVRQDLLESPAGVERWVRLLTRVLGGMLAESATVDRSADAGPSSVSSSTSSLPVDARATAVPIDA